MHCQYEGQAARHINTIGKDFIITVNSEHKVDIFKRGDPRRIKELEIEYMRYSIVSGSHLFIGTEEKLLYMVDTKTFTVIDKIATQNFVFTMSMIDKTTLICGQYQGFVDIIKIEGQNLEKIFQARSFSANVYKIVQTDQPNTFAFGCGDGLFFGTFDNYQQQLVISEEQAMPGKYITQICSLG